MNLVNRFKFVQLQLSILLMGTVKIVPGNLNIYSVSKIVILVSLTLEEARCYTVRIGEVILRGGKHVRKLRPLIRQHVICQADSSLQITVALANVLNAT